MIAAGHATALNLIDELSAFLNQSNRHKHPARTAAGSLSQSARDFTPPYRSPPLVLGAELARASIEDSESTAGNLQVEVILAEITTGVGHLNDELFASDRARCEDQRVARTAPVSFSLTLHTRQTHAMPPLGNGTELTAIVAAAKP